MATIGKEIAEKIVSNNGIYPGDPQCYMVFKYKNSFSPGDVNYAVVYSKEELINYTSYHTIVEILWKKKGE